MINTLFEIIRREHATAVSMLHVLQNASTPDEYGEIMAKISTTFNLVNSDRYRASLFLHDRIVECSNLLAALEQAHGYVVLDTKSRNLTPEFHSTLTDARETVEDKVRIEWNEQELEDFYQRVSVVPVFSLPLKFEVTIEPETVEVSTVREEMGLHSEEFVISIKGREVDTATEIDDAVTIIRDYVVRGTLPHEISVQRRATSSCDLTVDLVPKVKFKDYVK